MTARGEKLLGVTATTYLTLAIAWGPHRAFSIVVASAILTAWLWLCARYPIVLSLTISFVEGLFGLRRSTRRRR